MSLTEVAKKHRISRATVCRLTNEAGGLKNDGVAPIDNRGTILPPTAESGLPTAA
jgi:hypothetical protein